MADAIIKLILKTSNIENHSFGNSYEKVKYKYLRDHFTLFNDNNTVEYFLGEEDLIDLHQITLYGNVSLNVADDFTDATKDSRGEITDYDLSLLLQAMVHDSVSTALLSVTQTVESGEATTYYPSMITDYAILQTSYDEATGVLFVRYKLILAHPFYRMKTSISNYVYANTELAISNVANSIYKDNGFSPDLHFEHELTDNLDSLVISSPNEILNGESIFTNGNNDIDYTENEVTTGNQDAELIAHNFRIQYNETDFDFLSNLYRERGIYMVRNDLSVYHVKVSYSITEVNSIEYLYRTTTYYNTDVGLAIKDKLDEAFNENNEAGKLMQYMGLAKDYEHWVISETVNSGVTTKVFFEMQYAAIPIMKYTITDKPNLNSLTTVITTPTLSYHNIAEDISAPYIYFVDSDTTSSIFPSKVVVASYTPDTDTFNRYGQDPQPMAEVCYAVGSRSNLAQDNISLFPLNSNQTEYIYNGEGEKYYYESFIQSKSEAIRASVHRMQESMSKATNIQFHTSYHNLRPADTFNIAINSFRSYRKLFLNENYYITSTKIYAMGSIASADLAYEHEFKEVFRHVDSLQSASIRDNFVQIFTAIYGNTKYRPAYDIDSRKVINTSLSAQIYLFTASNQMVKDTYKPKVTVKNTGTVYDSFTDSIHYYPVVNEYGAYPIVFDFERQDTNSSYRGVDFDYHSVLGTDRQTVRASTLYVPKAKILADGLDTVGESLLLNHGQEIMVSFLGSKTDRPFISGVIQPDIENPLINHFTKNKIDYLRTPITNCGIYFHNDATTGSHISLETNGSDLPGADTNGNYSYDFTGENYMEIGDPTINGRGIKIGTEIYSRNVAQGLHENYFTTEDFVTSTMKIENKDKITPVGVYLDEQPVQLFPFRFDAKEEPDFSAMRNWAFPIIHKKTISDLTVSNYDDKGTSDTISDDTFVGHYSLDAQKYSLKDDGLKETLNLIIKYSSIYGFLTDNAQYLFSGVYYPYKSSDVKGTIADDGTTVSFTNSDIHYESLGVNHQYETVKSATYHLKSQHNNPGHYRRQIGTSHLYFEGKEYNFYDNSNQKVYIGPQRDLYLGSASNDMESPINITSGDEDSTFAREFRGINYVRNVIGKKYELTEGSKKGEYDYLFFKVIDSNEMTSETIESIGKTGTDQWRTTSGSKKLAKHAITVQGTVKTVQGDNGFTTLMDGSDMCTFTLNGAQVKKFRVMQFNLGIDMSMYLPAAVTSLSIVGNHALLYLVAEDWDVCAMCLYVMFTVITTGTMEINIRPMKIDLGKNANGSKELWAGIHAGCREIADSYSKSADCLVNGTFFYENCALKKADILNSNNL